MSVSISASHLQMQSAASTLRHGAAMYAACRKPNYCQGHEEIYKADYQVNSQTEQEHEGVDRAQQKKTRGNRAASWADQIRFSITLPSSLSMDTSKRRYIW